MGYSFGRRSRRELDGVHPDLIAVCEAAIAASPADFGVFDGLRTAAEQRRLFDRGVSSKDGYASRSRHQRQATGFGHAVDLVPWIGGRWQWDWPAIHDIAGAVVEAARNLRVDLRWGGCWEHVNPLPGQPEHWVEAYLKRKREQGRRPFADGPHFELWPARYETAAGDRAA